MTERSKIEVTADGSNNSVSMYDKAHLWMISIIHDSLYRTFVNPHRLLAAAGVQPGKVVLEVGCGPGFFTIPAAKIVGKNGRLYSLDINPAAIEHVKQKVEQSTLTNVQVILADAAKTGLPDGSIDVAFLFGVLHSIKDMDSVLLEMHRVIKEGGVLAVQKSSWSEKDLLNSVGRDGLFRFARKDVRVYMFDREAGYCKLESHQITIED